MYPVILKGKLTKILSNEALNLSQQFFVCDSFLRQNLNTIRFTHLKCTIPLLFSCSASMSSLSQPHGLCMPDFSVLHCLLNWPPHAHWVNNTIQPHLLYNSMAVSIFPELGSHYHNCSGTFSSTQKETHTLFIVTLQKPLFSVFQPKIPKISKRHLFFLAPQTFGNNLIIAFFTEHEA